MCVGVWVWVCVCVGVGVDIYINQNMMGKFKGDPHRTVYYYLTNKDIVHCTDTHIINMWVLGGSLDQSCYNPK